MLNEEKLKKIKNKLNKFNQERKLTLEQQQDEYLVKILDEIRKFILATTDEEMIEKLCNIAIFSLNTIEMDKIYYDHINDNKYNKSIGHILEILGQNIIDRTSVITKHTLNNKGNEEYCAITQILKICDKMANELGFDFYICLNEKIKELESHIEKWNDEKNEVEEFKVKDLYTSDFEKCRIEDFNKIIFINELSDYFRNTLDKAFINFIPNQKIKKIIPLIDMNYLSEASFTVLMDYSDYTNIRENNISDYNPNLAIRICNVKIDNFKELFPYNFVLEHHYNKDEGEFFIELICSNENFYAIQKFIIELRDYVLKNQDKIKIPSKKSNAKLQEELYAKCRNYSSMNT